ncbi:response regulator transcription factor [Mesorhizobium sp. C280B]|uniref:response regulator transcription factor n=1 Tax=unclassified Mesorhizobium TaxID=325217 RepID=UPI000417B2EB|nr:response regulator transcription factor [Mesorhizobium sp. LSJC280B00]
MRVLILATSKNPALDADIVEMLADYAADGGFEAEAILEPQDLCSALYRDPQAIGVIWTDSAGIASVICRNWRQAAVKNILFFLLVPVANPRTIGEEVIRRVGILLHGADDVQPAPIDKVEFVARLAALARRDRGPSVERLVKLPCEAVFDAVRGTVTHPGGTVLLTQTEASVLELLTLRQGSIVSKEMVMNFLYSGRDEPQIKIIDVLVCKIRRKLHAPLGGIDIIQTEWGRGYQFIPEGFVPALSDARVRAVG